MIDNFDKFVGKIKKDSLEKEEVIELVSLITDLKPSLPEIAETENLSKLIDNINVYLSEDGKYKISVYFRESDVYKNDELIGYLLQKNALYTWLKSQGYDYKSVLSKRLLPDECFYNVKNKTLYIAEKKYQNGAGSVDEKLQTCDYKMFYYLP